MWSETTYQLRAGGELLLQGVYDDEILSLFREYDRQGSVYQCSVQQLCDRLDVMGFRLADAQRAAVRFAQERISEETDYCVITSDEPEKQKAAFDASIDLLRRSSFEEWRDCYIRLLKEWHGIGHISSSRPGSLDKYLCDLTSEDVDAPVGGVLSPFGNGRIALRVMFSGFGMSSGPMYLSCLKEGGLTQTRNSQSLQLIDCWFPRERLSQY